MAVLSVWYNCQLVHLRTLATWHLLHHLSRRVHIWFWTSGGASFRLHSTHTAHRNISAFHLSGICGGSEEGVTPNVSDNVSCINILQVWRLSEGIRFSIAADFTATLAVAYRTPVTTSVTVDIPVPFSSGDVLGFTPGPNNPGLATSSQQQASHTYYTYDNFATQQEVRTSGSNRPTVMASLIISVEGRLVTH